MIPMSEYVVMVRYPLLIDGEMKNVFRVTDHQNKCDWNYGKFKLPDGDTIRIPWHNVLGWVEED